MNNFYTVLVIPEKTKQVKKVVLPSIYVRVGLLLGSVGVFFLAFMVYDYVNVMRQLSENRRLQTENRQLKQQMQAFTTKLQTVQDALERIQSYTTKLRIITNQAGENTETLKKKVAPDIPGLPMDDHSDLPPAKSIPSGRESMLYSPFALSRLLADNDEEGGMDLAEKNAPAPVDEPANSAPGASPGPQDSAPVATPVPAPVVAAPMPKPKPKAKPAPKPPISSTPAEPVQTANPLPSPATAAPAPTALPLSTPTTAPETTSSTPPLDAGQVATPAPPAVAKKKPVAKLRPKPPAPVKTATQSATASKTATVAATGTKTSSVTSTATDTAASATLSSTNTTAATASAVKVTPPEAQKQLSDLIREDEEQESAALRRDFAKLHLAFDSVLQHELTVELDVESLTTALFDQRDYMSSLPTLKPTNGWYTSGFGVRSSPFTGKSTMHEGLDLANHIGSAIVAAAAGVVTYAGPRPGYGNLVTINHGYGIQTQYGHISRHYVRVGDKVKRGQKVAAVGNTGRSTGPHVHYEVRVNGIPMDPYYYILED
ncbi:MAG TPA: peptidoglycan DD-metalloendopeptidase family protein [Bdellovibrionota bacterium]